MTDLDLAIERMERAGRKLAEARAKASRLSERNPDAGGEALWAVEWVPSPKDTSDTTCIGARGVARPCPRGVSRSIGRIASARSPSRAPSREGTRVPTCPRCGKGIGSSNTTRL